MVGVLPAVADIRVPVDQYHDPAVVIEDRTVDGNLNILFRIIVDIVDSGDHLRTVNIKETVKDLVILAEFHNRFVRENL
jgi:hypothetical protein